MGTYDYATAKVRYSEQVVARYKVNNAVKAGLLVRPDACERCGSKYAIEASHDDYSKPLDVEWLCRPCHVKKDLPTHCAHGHEFTPENTYVRPSGARAGHRECRACKRKRDERMNKRLVECPNCGLAMQRTSIYRHRERCDVLFDAGADA